jgi:hypothetical protein
VLCGICWNVFVDVFSEYQLLEAARIYLDVFVLNRFDVEPNRGSDGQYFTKC